MEKIGIVIAMQEEREKMQDYIENMTSETVSNMDFYIGKIADKKCIIVQSGVGKVNAARATQALIDNYKVTKIINVGAAASVNDLLNVGDIVIGKYVVQHDFDITAFGHSKGYITGTGNGVECNNDIIEKIQEAVNEEKKEIKEKTFESKLGIVATGDIFCTDVGMKDKIRAKFDADVVDMECGAVAQVAYLAGIPFGVIRGISDTPNGKNAEDFDKNLDKAGSICAKVLSKTIEKM